MSSDKENKEERRKIGYFAWCEFGANGFPLLIVLCLISFVMLRALNAADAKSKQSVIVYTSQDEEYADPIFHDFQKQTGIKVKAVYDSEAVKTVGLVNRLLAEARHTQCDVFWNNEEFRTRELAARGLFRETNDWAALGYRTRRLVVNTNLVPLASAPHRFSDATNSIWRGKVALAYPMFGTTSTHFFALRQLWGDAAWQSWCRALAANKPFLVDGNSVVVKLVGSGEAAWGFTDSDDIAAGQHEGLPIVALPMTEETLRISNTVGVLRGAPHPEAAQQLFEYLQSRVVVNQLVKAHALESESTDGGSAAGLKVEWNGMVRDLEAATSELKGVFLR